MRLSLGVVREGEAVWANTLGKIPVNRLIVTHRHPEHVGNCKWICDRWGITPTACSCFGQQEKQLNARIGNDLNTIQSIRLQG